MTITSLIPAHALFSLILTAGLLLPPISVADEVVVPLPEPSSRKGLIFNKDIKPLFERSCTKCHGEEKQKAKLRLDSLRSALRGAEDGKVIIPGRSTASKLVLVAAKATDDDTEWMPPPGKATELSPEEIGLVRAWIDQGAK